MEKMIAVFISIIPFIIWHLEKWCKRSGQRGKVKRKGEVYIRYGNSQNKQRLKKFEIFEKTCKILRYLILVISIIAYGYGVFISCVHLMFIGGLLVATSCITILGLDFLWVFESKAVQKICVIVVYVFLCGAMFMGRYY